VQQPDVIIIGTGQAAPPLAARLAAAGRRVVVIERAKPGGTCVNAGCTPTKTLVASARAAHVVRTSARLGIRSAPPDVDFAAVMARKDAMVQLWRAGVERRLASAGENLRFVRGHARFVGPRAVEVAGERLEAPQVTINVGARPAVPDLPGLAGVGALSSTSALDLAELPTRLLVLGAGYVACELGQIFARLGAEVTLVGRDAHLLPREDPAASEALEGALRAEGVRLVLGAPTARVARADGGVELFLAGDGAGAAAGPLRGSHLLVATGRTPNTHDLGCEAGNIARDASGHIVVDERYQTSQPGVFAVGDCTPGPQFTHVS
jgi:pyruvate/2-oxoglutarate dehydrogenase complex dihydrolipoamide dehydrogenase (E3) component